jgi:carbonic anhydrase
VTLLDNLLAANQRFVKPGAFPPLPKAPKKQFALFTCMDTRLVDVLEPAMGIKRGDAKILKNAGNTIVDPNGEMIRSLVVGIFTLGVEEILVIGHQDCGMAGLDAVELRKKMIARGIEPQAIDQLIPDLAAWTGAFVDPVINVENVVSVIRNSPLIPKDVPVHGLIFCPNDGHLDIVVQGY